MRFAPFTSLRFRLLLLLILVIIPAFGILAYGTVEARKKAAIEAQGIALLMARLVLLEQHELIAGARQLLPALARLPVVQAPHDGHVCGRVLAELLEKYPYYANFGVIGLDGLTRCSGIPIAKPLQLGDRNYFVNTIKTRDFAVGGYQIGRITGKGTLNFGYPIFDAQGRVDGVVFAALDLTWLSHRLMEVPLPAGTIITILDGTGTILAHHPDPQEWIGKSILYAPITKLILAHTREGTAESIDKTGTPRLYAFTPLHSTNETNVYVSVGIPRNVAYGELDRIFKRNLISLLLIAFAVIAIAWIGSNLIVLRPLNILAQASERLGQGDLDARAGLPPKTGELGQLAQTFDRMAESLQQRQKTLEMQDQELRRINRALQTLSAANHALIRAVDEPSLLQEMCRVAVELGGYRTAWVGYAEHDDRKNVRPVAQAGVEKAVLESLQISWAETEHGHGATGTAIRTRSPEVVRGLQTDPRYRGWNAIAREHGIHAALSLPLYVDRSVLGALTIYSQDADAFDAREIDILFEMAEDMAYGINTLRMQTRHKEAEATIHRMAYYDALTGLPNHASFEERLEQGIAAARAQNHSLAVALLDLDRLRDINGTLGFDAGNQVMMETGRRIQHILKPDEFIARMRGDEFAILLPRADAGYAEQTVLSILKTLQEPFAVDDLSLTIMAGTGIVLFPGHGTEAKQLIRLADVAMRLAKVSGNRYAFYAPEREVNKKHQLALAGDLYRALENNGLKLYYQPKISMKSGRICGVEALARWPHPRHGMIPPDEFITLAERTGMIRALSDWVLATALQQSKAWRQAGIGLPIAVNLSARNLQDPQLLEKIQALYATYKIDTGTLELEITESAIMEDPAGAYNILLRLTALGIPIYIDDFGTGYSSLGYLKKLPVSAIKIDKSFVIDMLNDKDSATIVRSTIMLGHDLGLEVVAEGVENEAVWAALTRLGCDVAQGYHMGKPMPAEQVSTWLNESPWGLRNAPPKK